MNRSQRIYLDVNSLDVDNHIKIKLEQETDSLEFLSMSIDTKDVYQDFNADYGVLVGRVIANGGIGIPNAKISIFMPLTDDDAENGEIYSIYPYKTPRDKNIEGKRYNLLPRVGKKNPATQEVKPKQPFGSFPIKEEIVTNEPFLNVYKKYYKYTATTNDAGDYMIFGVPIGTQTVHLSVDITDIGKYSMTPAAMVTNLGYSPNLFTDGGSKIKPSNDLGDLPHIETQEISVDIIPFWGDVENFEIGITRQDFRIRSVLSNTFTIFGSIFTDGDNSMWGANNEDGRTIRELYKLRSNTSENKGMVSKRIGIVTEKIYYYPASINDSEISTADPKTDMLLLDPTQYSAYKRDGDFVFIINCNRGRVITDEFGNETPVDENSSTGVYTKFKGFMTLEATVDDIPMNFTGDLGSSTTLRPIRYKFKFPQFASEGRGLRRDNRDSQSQADVQTWRKQHYTFSGGGFYSVSRFHGVVYNAHNNENENNDFDDHTNNAFSNRDAINDPKDRDTNWDVGIIQTNDVDVTGNTQYGMVYNTTYSTQQLFGANWLNFAIHLPQVAFLSNGYSYVENWRSNTNFTHDFKSTHFFGDNSQIIAGNDFNTKFMARSDLHWTDFIHVPKEDLPELKNMPKGFKGTGTNGNSIPGYTLKGKYRNGKYIPSGWTAACPLKGGRLNGDADVSTQDPNTYFYKGFDTADCIDYLYLLGLV
jgi:hypothetical protein